MPIRIGGGPLGHSPNVEMRQMLQRFDKIHLLKHCVNPSSVHQDIVRPIIAESAELIRGAIQTNNTTSLFHTSLGKDFLAHFRRFLILNLASLQPTVVKIGPLTLKAATTNLLQASDEVVKTVFMDIFVGFMESFVTEKEKSSEIHDKSSLDFFKQTTLYKVYLCCRPNPDSPLTPLAYKMLLSYCLDATKARIILALFDQEAGEEFRMWLRALIYKDFKRMDVKKAGATETSTLIDKHFEYEALFVIRLMEKMCSDGWTSFSKEQVLLSAVLLDVNSAIVSMPQHVDVNVFDVHAKY